MFKKATRLILCFILTVGIVLTTSGCFDVVTSFVDFVADYINGTYPEDKYKVIESPDEGEDYAFGYNGEKYYYVEDHVLNIDTDKIEPVLISWRYNFPFSTYSLLYSYVSDSPYYIYKNDTSQPVYINEKYDYKSDVFVLENTDVDVKFSDTLIEENTIEFDTFRPEISEFNLYLKSHPEVYADVEVVSQHGTYYIGFNTGPLYQISPEFLQILIENGFIE